MTDTIEATATPFAVEKTYTFDEVYAAACMWEYAIDCFVTDRGSPYYEYRKRHGAAATRDTVLTHVRELQADWAKAHAEGYEDCFDWEYVPAWMEKHAARIVPLF